MYEFFRSCIDDGIMYTEARINFLQKYVVCTLSLALLVLIFLLSSVIRTMKDENGQDTITHDKWIEVFDNMLHRIREELCSERKANQFFSAKVNDTNCSFFFTMTKQEPSDYLYNSEMGNNR